MCDTFLVERDVHCAIDEKNCYQSNVGQLIVNVRGKLQRVVVAHQGYRQ